MKRGTKLVLRQMQKMFNLYQLLARVNSIYMYTSCWHSKLYSPVAYALCTPFWRWKLRKTYPRHFCKVVERLYSYNERLPSSFISVSKFDMLERCIWWNVAEGNTACSLKTRLWSKNPEEKVIWNTNSSQQFTKREKLNGGRNQSEVFA